MTIGVGGAVGYGRSYANRTFHSLGNPNYRKFWISLIFLMAGINMQHLARGQLAWDLTHDAFLVALVGAGFAPPILIFGLFGGSLADRWNRRRMIQYAQLIVSLVALFVAISIVMKFVTIWVLFGAALTQGLCWSFMMPARQAIIPQLVPDGELTNAVALNASGMALMTLSGPAIGGLAYWWIGPEATYFLMSGLMFVAFLMMTRVRVARPDAAAPGRRRENVFNSVLDGIRYSARNKTILVLLLLTLATTMTSQSFRSLMPAQVDLVFGGDAKELGILMSTIGVGALIGSLFIAGLTENVKRGVVLLVAGALSAVAILVSTYVTVFLIGIVAMLALGLGDSGRRALNSALILEQTDAEHRGRVMGIYMLNFGLRPIGAIPLGILAERTSLQTSFAVAGAVLLVSVILTWILAPRIRNL
ncbi:MAG: MFS transporter [Chloroflexi bacterium]|nr:MFS transporter [Chloroflexota bacterium]